MAYYRSMGLQVDCESGVLSAGRACGLSSGAAGVCPPQSSVHWARLDVVHEGRSRSGEKAPEMVRWRPCLAQEDGGVMIQGGRTHRWLPCHRGVPLPGRCD